MHKEPIISESWVKTETNFLGSSNVSLCSYQSRHSLWKCLVKLPLLFKHFVIFTPSNPLFISLNLYKGTHEKCNFFVYRFPCILSFRINVFLSFFLFFFYFDRQEVDRMLVRDTSGQLRGLSRIDVNLLKCSVLSCLF